MIPGSAWAQGAPSGSPSGGPMAVLVQLVPFFLIFIIFYFLLVRPQQKRQREHQKFLEGLKKGDRVATSGGILGTVIGVYPERVVLKISEETKVEFLKSAVTGMVAEKGESKG